MVLRRKRDECVNLPRTHVRAFACVAALRVADESGSPGAPRPASSAKIYFFARDPNHPYNSRHPVPVEGRWPSSRTLGRVAVDAAASGAWWCSQGGPWSVSEHNVQTTGEAAYGKAVWFWHPWLVSSRRRKRRPNRVSTILQSAGDGGKRNSSPGRARYKPSNHCAGNAGVLQLYLYARVRFFALIAHETAGAASTRHSLRPLLRWANDYANLGRIAPRDCGDAFSGSHVIASARRSNPVSPRMRKRWIASRCARNDGLSTRNNSQQIAPASEWQLRLRRSALMLDNPLLNRRP